MSEGVSPVFLRVSKAILLGLLCAVFVVGGASRVLAHGGGADAGQAANNPSFPIGGPGTFPVPPNSPGGNPGAGGGAGGGDAGGGEVPAEPAPAVEEVPTLQVVSNCGESFFASFNCMIINFFGSFVAIAGLTFDTAIGLFIIQFGEQYLSTNIGLTIESLWGTVRDIFNLTFIFGIAGQAHHTAPRYRWSPRQLQFVYCEVYC